MTSFGPLRWSIADLLRRPCKRHQYGDVILSMVMLRRLDRIRDGSRDEVRQLATKEQRPELVVSQVELQFGLNFHNTSPWDLEGLVSNPDGLKENLIDYRHRCSDDIDVFDRLDFDSPHGRQLDPGAKDLSLEGGKGSSGVTTTGSGSTPAPHISLLQEAIERLTEFFGRLVLLTAVGAGKAA